MSTCRTLAVVHGKSELILCKGIARELRINIECDSDNNGETCIQILHLEERFCTGPYKTEGSLHRKFDKLEYLKGRSTQMPRLKIFSIMDTDDSHQSAITYKTGNMFRSSAFKDRIVPIFNTPSLDAVMKECGFEINCKNSNEKIRSYHDLINDCEVPDLIEKLKNCKNTNLWVFLEHCTSIASNFQS